MPLVIVTGRSGAGKCNYAEQRFAAAERAVLIVPEQASHEMEYRLTEKGLEALKSEVARLRELADNGNRILGEE